MYFPLVGVLPACSSASAATAVLATSNLAVTGGYTITEGLDASIGVGGSDTFTIQHSTAAVGAFPATVSFDNDDTDEDPYSFTVSGTVVVNVPTLTEWGRIAFLVTLFGAGAIVLTRKRRLRA